MTNAILLINASPPIEVPYKIGISGSLFKMERDEAAALELTLERTTVVSALIKHYGNLLSMRPDSGCRRLHWRPRRSIKTLH